MADYVPTFTPGKSITETTSAAVTGGRLVGVSGSGTVATSAADSAVVVGVAAFDVAASGDKLTVWPIKSGVHGLVASGAITAGAGVVSDTGGKVKSATIATAAAAGTLLGIAKTTVTTDLDIVQVQGG